MGIAKKNKRKLNFQNRDYYWWVKDDFDGNGSMLEINIATEDKSFLIKYYSIQEETENRYITVVGKLFPGLDRKKGNWLRFICPNFIPNVTIGITPKDVVSILTWCYDSTKTLIAVNYKGEKV